MSTHLQDDATYQAVYAGGEAAFGCTRVPQHHAALGEYHHKVQHFSYASDPAV